MFVAKLSFGRVRVYRIILAIADLFVVMEQLARIRFEEPFVRAFIPCGLRCMQVRRVADASDRSSCCACDRCNSECPRRRATTRSSLSALDDFCAEDGAAKLFLQTEPAFLSDEDPQVSDG